MLKASTILFIIIAILIIIFFIQAPTNGNEYSLNESYNFYKTYFMTKDGRIMDPQRKYITTSEGQSYMMLMSFLMNDKETFDLVFTWTKNNLQQKNHLFGWLWGENKDGDYKILDVNSASDADTDIAFALILAYEKWQDEKYLNQARAIINSIWENETREINGIRIMLSGALQACCEKVEINPSYFSPYAYKTFQKYDDHHDWDRLVDSSYFMLDMAVKSSECGLPPDWAILQNNKLSYEKGRSDFSYDAIRVFPRIYLDYVLTSEQRALPILEKAKFFLGEWGKSRVLYTNYKLNGELKDKNRFIGSIALLIPVIGLYNKSAAKEIYYEEIAPVLKNKSHWENKKEYYAQNLLWFGQYLYQNASKLEKHRSN